MKFDEYMIAPLWDDERNIVDSMKINDIRKAAESMVNCFGYNPIETIDILAADPLGRSNALLLALYFVLYEAKKERWIDARNETEVWFCKQFCEFDGFKELVELYSINIDAPESIQDKFFIKLMQAFGGQMHRTLLQTFSSFVFAVLGDPEERFCKGVGEQVRELLGQGDRFWRMPMI